MHPLDGPGLRVQRAYDQFQALDKELRGFVKDEEPNAVKGQRGAHRQDSATFRIADFPPLWPVLLGEIFHDLNAALDNAAYALSVHDAADQSVPKGIAPDGTQFPIFRWRTLYERHDTDRSGGLYKIRGIGPRGHALFESLQPFIRTENGGVAEDDPLWVLAQLNNIDKHRVLHLCSALVDSTGIALAAQGPHMRFEEEWVHDTGRIENGAAFAKWRLAYPAVGKVQVHFAFTVDVAIDESVEDLLPVSIKDRPIRETVRPLCEAVASVLDLMEPLFE